MSDDLVLSLRAVDLVRRLRAEEDDFKYDVLHGLCEEAADRIEALEPLEEINQSYLNMYKKCCEDRKELETRIVGLEAFLVDADKREQELEAALREIADYQPPKPTIEELEVLLREEPTEPVHINTDGSVSRDVQAIARRALGEKP